MKKITLLKIIASIISAVSIGFIVFKFLVLNSNIIVDAIIVSLFVILIIVIFYMFDTFIKEANSNVENSVEGVTKAVFEESKVGILLYDEDYEIVWLSKLFTERNLDHVGEKIFSWLPELEHLLKSGQESETVIINDDKFLVTKKEENTLIFKDITIEYDLRTKNEEDKYVFGLLSYDNYDESIESEDTITYINTNIKSLVTEYFKKYGVGYKRLRSNRALLILNELKFNELLNDRFSILNKVREESKKGDILVTLSIGFARGSEDMNELDSLAQELLELALTRGGDQVVSRIVGKEAVFYGGSTEAREDKSKVKVRVVANSLKDLIIKSSNVIVFGHEDSDADSIGASICISTIAHKLNKDAYIVCDENSIDSMIDEVLDKYKQEISEKHNLVNESEAISHMDNETLVVMVDHHSAKQSIGKNILSMAKNIVIIDHHRRQADLDVSPNLVYIEAGSSSACELTAEFLPYLTKRNPLSAAEAVIMYIGLIIDTNHFRNRTDARTFEVAKALRNYGADPLLCEELSQEPFENIKKKAELVDNAYEHNGDILISSSEDIYQRSIASQACDSLVQVKNINAAFVICNVGKGEAIISARSNGKVNVQTILEKMHGGGHMTAAGLQTTEKTVAELEEELLVIIDENYKKDVE